MSSKCTSQNKLLGSDECTGSLLSKHAQDCMSLKSWEYTMVTSVVLQSVSWCLNLKQLICLFFMVYSIADLSVHAVNMD